MTHQHTSQTSAPQSIGEGLHKFMFGDESAHTDTDKHGVVRTIGDQAVKGIGFGIGLVLGVGLSISGS